jgi:hypothetical protein
MIQQLFKKASLFIFVLFFTNNVFAQNDFVGRWL